MTKLKFLICKHCGNVIVFTNDSGVTPVCCGEKMQILEANTTDAAFEKHVPVVSKEGNAYKVQVDSDCISSDFDDYDLYGEIMEQ